MVKKPEIKSIKKDPEAKHMKIEPTQWQKDNTGNNPNYRHKEVKHVDRVGLDKEVTTFTTHTICLQGKNKVKATA
jgi:hypothetical protein